ncbi:L-aminoadipate-semialdehyde dehydrogenase-phosphopantetheinyl transferase [Ischnura elegans]|uniref:L-aminoadipate-semialdehyde dehydrogenase-phosphopantetheinyl transferase n=1 Tax=Ischnura elegans TaxID=197161 RepID=UPI001ED89DA8|nr:L-aminoadipate-semialdehyde dehydrogenase-phosphopantetheinyl transferase [Ischnura elegans]
MECSQWIKQAVSNGVVSVRWAFDFASWKPTESEIVKVFRCIQGEEKERIGRFVYKKDAKASLIGRLMMRKYVSQCTGIRYDEIRIARDDSGKPFLANDSLGQDLLPFFNVSHQGNFTVLAGEFGKRSEMKLGVDVMKLEYTGGKGIAEFFRIMNRQFSKNEWETIKKVGEYGGTTKEKDEWMLRMFCRNWCLKESYVKATGTGITVDLQKISFKVASDILSSSYITKDSTVCVNGQVLKDWNFEESLLNDEHCVAVAVCRKGEASNLGSNVFKQVDLNELLLGSIPIADPDLKFSKEFIMKEEKPV